MRVYNVEYVLTGDSKTRQINIYAPSVKNALDKLSDRFGGELAEFHIQSFDKEQDAGSQPLTNI
jgi:hypothetical protein